MRRTTVAIGTCVCLVALVAVAMAQGPAHVGVAGAPPPIRQATPEDGPPPGPATGRVTIDPHTGAMTDTFLVNGVEQPPLEQMVNQLLANWKESKDVAYRDEMLKQLRTVLKEQFQVRVGGHQKEIEQLEAKVKELRQQLELRRVKEDEIVDFRLQQLLREAQGLGWGTEPGAGQVGRSMNSSSYRTVINDGGSQAFGMSSGRMGGGGFQGGMGGGGFQGSRMGGVGIGSGSVTVAPLGVGPNGFGMSGGGRTTAVNSDSGISFGTTSVSGKNTPTLNFAETARPQGTLSISTTAAPNPGKSAQFVEFFKSLDTNNNGMLEEDEVKNTPAKFIVEGVYKELGKQLKYPVAISEVLKAMDDFPGTIRIRERGDGKGNVNRDVEMNVAVPGKE
jgi:hypothetical protein